MSLDNRRLISQQDFNRWRQLEYHDPQIILRRLRALEIELGDVEIDARVRRLRSTELKKYREWRDAAVFLYGLGLSKGLKIMYATLEESDYDFVASWVENGTQRFCPVQLKELPPTDLNPDADLEKILAGSVKDPRPTSTVLLVKLSKAGPLDLTRIQIPTVPWKEVWLFWASAPGASRFTLYGDALTRPDQFSYDYPT